MKKKFIEVVSQYPLPIPIYSKEDYQTWPVLMMKEKGFTVKIITLKKKGQKKRELINNIEIIRFTNFLKLFLYIILNKDALFYAQGKIFPLFTGFFAKKAVYITHLTMGKKLPKYLSNPFLRFIYKRSLSSFNKVITISPYEKSLLEKLGFKDNLIYIPNAIDFDFFSKPYVGKEFAEKNNLKKKSKKIVFLGNLHQGDKTNIETLFKAFKIILGDFPDSKLIVIGKFPKKIITHKELTSIKRSVIFTGWLPHFEFIKAFAVADVFVNTSRYEGNPLSIAEAACARIPICLSDIPTLKSIYKESALYHDPNDFFELAKNIKIYLKNQKLAKKKSEEINKVVKDGLNINIVKTKMENLFVQVFKNK